MTPIERLRALLDEATPRPWEAEDTSDVNDDLFSDDERESPLSTGWFSGIRIGSSISVFVSWETGRKPRIAPRKPSSRPIVP